MKRTVQKSLREENESLRKRVEELMREMATMRPDLGFEDDQR